MPNMPSFSIIPVVFSARHAMAWRALSGSRVLACAIALGLSAQTSTVHAEKADRDQPLNFSADSARVDEHQKLNILTGRVEITKGTMVFRAARVEIRQNSDGTQTARATGATDGRAYFRQKREGLDEFIEGESDSIEFDGRLDTVRFTGHAVMRRINGTILADEVTGQTIVYDNKTEVFQVVGGAASGVSSGRVRGVITPRPALKSGATAPIPVDPGATLTTTTVVPKLERESAR